MGRVDLLVLADAGRMMEVSSLVKAGIRVHVFYDTVTGEEVHRRVSSVPGANNA